MFSQKILSIQISLHTENLSHPSKPSTPLFTPICAYTVVVFIILHKRDPNPNPDPKSVSFPFLILISSSLFHFLFQNLLLSTYSEGQRGLISEPSTSSPSRPKTKTKRSIFIMNFEPLMRCFVLCALCFVRREGGERKR